MQDEDKNDVSPVNVSLQATPLKNDDQTTLGETLNDPSNDRISPFQQAIASCSGALITSIFVTPLDVVKIRLQAQEKARNKCFLYCNGLMDHYCSCSPKWALKPTHFTGTMDAFIKIWQTEGPTSLWSGLSPTLVLAIPATIVYFVVYEQLRLILKDKYNENLNVNEKRSQPFWIPMISGSTARLFSVTLVSPLELIRTKMQSERLNYLQVGEALTDLVQHEGVKGLWRGIFPTLYRDVPFSSIYWLHYETIKSMFCEADKVPKFWVSFVAGAISGSVAAFLTTPFDVIKTHQQIEFGESALYNKANAPGSGKKRMTTTLETFKQIRGTQGFKGLFTGTIPRLIRVAPACAIMISSFEYGKVIFKKRQRRRDDGPPPPPVPFSKHSFNCFEGVLACVPPV